MSKAAPARLAPVRARQQGNVLPKLSSGTQAAGEHTAPAWITPRRPRGSLAPLPARKGATRTERADVEQIERSKSSGHVDQQQPALGKELRRKSDTGKGSVLMVGAKSRRISGAGKDGGIVGAVSHQIIEGEENIEDAFLDVPSYVEKRKVVILESEPILVLEKKSIPRFGKTKKTSLQTLRSAEAKSAAEAIMQSRDPGQKPRYAKQEPAKPKGRNQRPLIEVMEVDGAALLGVPGTSHVQQFSTYVHNGRQKQIVIAMHEHKPLRMQGATGATESDSAVMRSGVAELSKQLVTLRESLRESRMAHNAFNELSKYHTSV